MSMISLKQFLIILCLGMLSLSAQSQTNDKHLVLDINRSKNGTGDMRGASANIQYNKKASKKFDWYGELGFTMHDSKYTYTYPNLDNVETRSELKFVTAGMQIGAGGSYNPLSTKKSKLFIQLGPIVRYQFSSLPDITDTYYPALTKFPFALSRNIYEEKARLVTLGGKLRIGYFYQFKKGLLLGINGNYQTDTNGDGIYGYGLSIGKSFN